MKPKENDLVKVRRTGNLGKVIRVMEHQLLNGNTVATYDIQFEDTIERYTQSLADKELCLPRRVENGPE